MFFSAGNLLTIFREYRYIDNSFFLFIYVPCNSTIVSIDIYFSYLTLNRSYTSGYNCGIKKQGPARVRTGVSGIFSMKIHLKNQSDNHYTTEPILTGKRIV